LPNDREPQTLLEFKRGYEEMLHQRSVLARALRPFAEAADALDKWEGGPPLPAHAYGVECQDARRALQETIGWNR
jgi:hypothetical protein